MYTPIEYVNYLRSKGISINKIEIKNLNGAYLVKENEKDNEIHILLLSKIYKKGGNGLLFNPINSYRSALNDNFIQTYRNFLRENGEERIIIFEYVNN